MPKVLDTVVSYEDQLVGLVKNAKAPVTEYVAKGVELLQDRVPKMSYPSTFATPIEVVETQAAFVKKLIDANASLVTAVLERVAPIAGYPKTAKRSTAAKRSSAAKAAKAA